MIKRCDSETYLKNAEAGTFLVRESETRPGTLSLSVRAEINESGAPIIKHFCIRTKSTTGEVFISNKIEFPSVHDLIAYYRQHKGKCAGVYSLSRKFSVLESASFCDL